MQRITEMITKRMEAIQLTFRNECYSLLVVKCDEITKPFQNVI